MIVKSDQDLRALKRIGQIVGLTIQHMAEHIEPGMTTTQLDAIGAAFLKKHSARSAPILVYNFPGHTCISINEEVAHGIPGPRIIKPGDLVNIDVTAELEGYFADTGGSFAVPPTTPDKLRLLDCTRQALKHAIAAATSGKRVNVIGKAVETYAHKQGYTVVRQLRGHGVGRSIHEKPSVPNYFTSRAKEKLTEGLVIAIEPFLNTGNGQVVTADDKWTLKTTDGSMTAQFEHTVVVNGNSPIRVTAVSDAW